MGHSSKASGRSNKSIDSNEIGVCIFCEQSVYRREYFNFAIDRPFRLDLPVHKLCYKSHRDNGNLKAFLQENLLDYFYKYIDEEEYGKKKKANRTTKQKTDQ